MKHFKHFGQKSTFLVIMLSLLFFNIRAGVRKEVTKTFKPKSKVEIKTVCGDCIIKKGSSSEIKVHVVYTFSNNDFVVVFEEKGNALVMKEEFRERRWKRSFQGNSQWTVTLPEKTKVQFKSASGDLDVEDLMNGLSVKVASGDVSLKNVFGNIQIENASGEVKIDESSGDITVEVASGDITLSAVKGKFNISGASSDIDADGIELNGDSNLKTVSGDLLIKLSKASTVDLNLKTVSGNVTLDYNGNPVKGYFEFKGKKGNISSDIPFDNQEEHRYNPFVTRYFNKGESPRISMKTVSGDLEFKK